MEEQQRALAEHACTRLVHQYANCIDAYDYDGFLNLWADDGEWVIFGKSMLGSDAIRAALEARPPRSIVRHLVSNTVIDIVDATRATGASYALAYRAEERLGMYPSPLALPRFLLDLRDEFSRHPTRGWLFQRRQIISILERDPLHG